MAQMLFVCSGNVCRSAYAERDAARIASSHGGLDWQFASAGVIALAGAPMDAPMAHELTGRGGDAAGFVARQLDREIIMGADLIVAMETYHRQVILADHPTLVRRTFTLGQLVHAVNGYPELFGDELLKAVGHKRVRARAEDDIADPYCRGAQVARRTAAEITELLEILLSRLVDVCQAP